MDYNTYNKLIDIDVQGTEAFNNNQDMHGYAYMFPTDYGHTYIVGLRGVGYRTQHSIDIDTLQESGEVAIRNKVLADIDYLTNVLARRVGARVTTNPRDAWYDLVQDAHEREAELQ